MPYYVYIVQCADGTLYTGSTNDIEKRLVAHNESKTGAKYTKARRPVVLKYFEQLEDRGQALKREHVLKRLSRAKKLELAS